MALAGERIAALDLIRGIAVLGIVAVNITSFAAPPSALYSPDLPTPGSASDRATWLGVFVLFEGKMRTLFSILFGASLILFVERADAAGRDGERLQFRRLGWLALFGYLHFLLLWDGDILFLYAVAGLIAVQLRHGPPLALVASALFLFTLWQAWGWSMWHGPMATEAEVAKGTASVAETAAHREVLMRYRQTDAEELNRVLGPGSSLIAYKALIDPLRPLRIVFYALGEVLSLVLIGMALLKAGFFAGHWRRSRLIWLALGGIGSGTLVTVWTAQWAVAAGFPEIAMRFAINYGLGFARLATALGYAAVLMLGAQYILNTGIGTRLVTAGRMAFTNYIATSVILGAVFYGWGLGLSGTQGAANQAVIVLAVWAVMLGASTMWLRRFRQGPLEALWRRLTNGPTQT